MQAINSTTARQRRGPFDELERLFEALDDAALLVSLQATRWTGRPGFPLRVMWRTLVASFYLGIVHDTDLVRGLQSNPLLASACGIESPDGVPSKFAYCRFRRKLLGFNNLIADVLGAAVEQLREALPGFGTTVAVDATDVHAWANGFHQETDPDAKTGAKKKGTTNTYYWYGYKVHLAVDAVSELPIWFELTPGNVYDGKHLAPVLHDAKHRFNWFSPEYVLADKGYDSGDCFRFVGEAIGAVPVIDVRHYKSRRFENEAKPCEAMPVITPTGTHYRCGRLPYDPNCSRFGTCPLLPMFADSPLNEPEPAPYYERYAPFAYGSREWKLLYNKRVSVERVFSRLKTFRKLDAVRTRRLPKVWLHVALSLLAMLGSVTGAPSEARRCVSPV